MSTKEIKCCSTTSTNDISVQTNDTKNTSNIVSEVEKAILNATNQPIQISTENEIITVNGETGIWTNKAEAEAWKGPIPICKYPVNKDPCPQIINKKTKEVECKRDVFVKYLEPPKIKTPGPIVINQEANKLPPIAPPIVIRQVPCKQVEPETIVIREAPPQQPNPPYEKVITIPGKLLPPPPRKVVIERLPEMPNKPQDIILERWLPFKDEKRKIKLNPKPADPIQCKPRNIIINWEKIECSKVITEIKNLGIEKADPFIYTQQHGASLKAATELPDIANEVKVLHGIPLAAENTHKYYMELEGDIHALALIDLEKEGLSEYKHYLDYLKSSDNSACLSNNSCASNNSDSASYANSQDNLDKKSPNQSINQYESADDTFKSYKLNSNYASVIYEGEKEAESSKSLENSKSPSMSELLNQKFEATQTGSFKLDNSYESLGKVSDVYKSDFSIKPTEGTISSTYILKPESTKLVSDSVKSTGSSKSQINKSETFKLISSPNKSLENIKSSSSNKSSSDYVKNCCNSIKSLTSSIKSSSSSSVKSSNSIKSMICQKISASLKGETPTKLMTSSNTKQDPSPVLSKQRTFSSEEAIKDYIYSTFDKMLTEQQPQQQEPVKLTLTDANILTNVTVDLDHTSDQTVDLSEKELIEQKIREEEERESTKLQINNIETMQINEQQITKKQKLITSTPYPSITEYNLSNKILEQLNSEQTSEIERSLLQEKIKQELLKVQGQVLADETLALTKSMTESAVTTAAAVVAHETDADISLTEKEMFERTTTISVGDQSFEDQKSTASLEAAVDFLVEKLVKIVRDGSYE